MRNLNAGFQAKCHSLFASINFGRTVGRVMAAPCPVQAPRKASSTRDDDQLRSDVNEELRYDPALHAGLVHVEVRKGAVTLTGTAEDGDENALIEAAAWRIAGVTSLSNRLEIPLEASHQAQDEDVRQACDEALRKLMPQSDYAVAVSVSSAWAMLSGSVVSGSQRWTAEETVRHVPGVQGVNGQLTVRPVVMQEDVRANIMTALDNMKETERPGIDIVVTKRRVLVKGQVHSIAQHRAIINAVRSTEGVQDVTDEVTILGD